VGGERRLRLRSALLREHGASALNAAAPHRRRWIRKRGAAHSLVTNPTSVAFSEVRPLAPTSIAQTHVAIRLAFAIVIAAVTHEVRAAPVGEPLRVRPVALVAYGPRHRLGTALRIMDVAARARHRT
jgi:hypothetical protein